RFDPRELALRRVDAGAALHAEAVHVVREFAAELFEEVVAHQLVLQRCQDARLDFLPGDRQVVVARSSTASAKASEMLARVHDVAGAADATFCQAGEVILRTPESIEGSRRI